MQRYEWLTAERLPARPFTDPERTLADATVMDRMLRRLRRQARSWPSWRTSAELLTHTRGGLALHADHRWITGCPDPPSMYSKIESALSSAVGSAGQPL